MLSKELNTFIKVAETGSFSKAANDLYIATTAVMKQMNNFESRMGVVLLKRTNQGIVLTRAGWAIYRAALRITGEVKATLQYAAELQPKEQVVIRIGSSLLNPCRKLQEIWRQISCCSIDYRFEIVSFEDNHKKILSTLAALGRNFDIMIGSCDSIAWQKVASLLPLGYYKLCCAVPLNHRLASREIIYLEELSGENLIMVKEGDSPVLNQFRNEIMEKYPDIHIIDTHQWYDEGTFNECAVGEGLLLTLDAWSEIHPFLVTIPIACRYQIPYGVLYPPQPSPEVSTFIKLLDDWKTYSKEGNSDMHMVVDTSEMG